MNGREEGRTKGRTRRNKGTTNGKKNHTIAMKKITPHNMEDSFSSRSRRTLAILAENLDTKSHL